MQPLAQPPNGQDSALTQWLFLLWKRINSAAGMAWSIIDKTGSKLTDIEVSELNTLQFLGGIGTQGTVSWNTDEETLDLIQNGATLQIGQEVQVHCRNNSGADIPDGTPVMATGSLGASGRITISPMDGTSAANVDYMLGIATEAIANGTDGKVTTFGKIRGIDTTGTSVGETWLDGDVLWVSPTTAGALTNVKPSIHNLGMAVALVVKAHATVGTLMVRVTSFDENAFIPLSRNSAIHAFAAAQG